jgi:fatty acid desaturase
VYLNTERDPDIIFSQPKAGAADVIRGVVADLFMLSALRRLFQYSLPDRATHSVSLWRTLTPRRVARSVGSMLPVVFCQLALVGIFTYAGGRWAYVVLHVVPIMTIYPLQIRIRSMAEHAFEAGYVPSTPVDAWMARTSQLNFLERWVVAPFGQHFHYEHHVFPGVPNYNLRQVHELLGAAGISVPTNRSYFGFVWSKIRAEWGERKAVRETRCAIPPGSEL